MGSRPATGREIGAARGGAGRCENGKKEKLSSAKRDIAISSIDIYGYSQLSIWVETRHGLYTVHEVIHTWIKRWWSSSRQVVVRSASDHRICIIERSRSISSKDIALSLQCCETKGNFNFSANKSLSGETVGTAIVATKRSIPQMLLAHLKEVVRKANSFCAKDLEVTISSR